MTAMLACCVSRETTAAQLALWTAEPCRNFAIDAQPPAAARLTTLDVHAAQDEYEASVLMITNLGAATEFVRVSLTNAKTEVGRPLPLKHVVLREALHVRARNGFLVADPLPKLNAQGIVTAPPRETRQVWFEVRTHGLDAGDYLCRVQVEPLRAPGPRSVELRVHVWDFKLPQRVPLTVFNWDYAVQGLRGPMRTKAIDAMVAHRINAFHLTGAPPVVCDDYGRLVEQPDFSVWDELIALEKPHGVLLFETWQFRRKPIKAKNGKELAYLSAEWVRAFEAWLRAFVAYTRERGLTYTDWFFYPFDEHIGPKFAALAREIKRIDPRIRVFSDQIGTPEEVRAAAPYTDVWCPNDRFYTSAKHRAGIEAMRATGKPMWFYSCHRGQKRLPPLQYYRHLGWKAWHRRLQGCTYFLLFSRPGQAWDDFDSRDGDSCTAYWGREGPIPSRRWEAFRDGLEDYCYLWLLDRVASAARPSRAAAQAKQLLRTVAPEVLAETRDPTRMLERRRHIARLITELKGQVK